MSRRRKPNTAHAQFRAKANRGTARPALIAPTVRDFYDAYFDLIAEGISASTADGYRTVIKGYVLPRFGEMRLSVSRAFRMPRRLTAG